MPQSSPDYKFFAIHPGTLNLPLLAQKHKKLRLSALQLSPDAFSSTYALEAALPDAAWVIRLNATGKTLFVCSTTSLDPADEEWAAVVTLIGPMTTTAFTLAPNSGQPSAKSDDLEEGWQLSSLYTLPTHRGNSLGRGLSEFAIDELRAASETPELGVRLMIKPTNTVVIKMYERMGFQQSGRCTLEEALLANGETEHLPSQGEMDGVGEVAETLRKKFRNRAGLVMQLVRRRQ